jgi:hypothetical protein
MHNNYLVRTMRFWNNLNQLHSKSKYFKRAFGLKKEATRMVGYPPLILHFFANKLEDTNNYNFQHVLTI